MPEIEILKAGEWPSANAGMVKIGSEIIDDVVETYDAATFRAPLIVSHDTEGEDDRNLAEHKELAHGFPARLKRVGDRIVAEFDKISDKFVNWNRGGELLSVSASLYPPSSPANPYPGKWSLRHIAGLGKNPPAVKGLAPLSLQAGDGAEGWCFDLVEFGLQDDDEAIDLMGYGKMMMHKNYDEDGEEEDDFKERLYKRLGRCENKIMWQGGAFRSIADFLAGMRDWVIAEKGLEVADKMLPRYGLAAIADAGRFDSPEFGELMEGFVNFAKGKGGKGKGKGKAKTRNCKKGQVCGASCISKLNKDGSVRRCHKTTSSEAKEAVAYAKKNAKKGAKPTAKASKSEAGSKNLPEKAMTDHAKLPTGTMILSRSGNSTAEVYKTFVSEYGDGFASKINNSRAAVMDVRTDFSKADSKRERDDLARQIKQQAQKAPEGSIFVNSFNSQGNESKEVAGLGAAAGFGKPNGTGESFAIVGGGTLKPLTEEQAISYLNQDSPGSKNMAEHPTGNVAASNDAREADMSELEELQRQVAALKAERDAIADEAKTARLEAIQNFLEGHIDRFTPAMQQQQSISFGEESLEMDALDFMMALEPQHLAWFKNMVKQMPPQVELGEVAGDADAPERVTNLNEQMQAARAKLQDAYNKAAGL